MKPIKTLHYNDFFKIIICMVFYIASMVMMRPCIADVHHENMMAAEMIVHNAQEKEAVSSLCCHKMNMKNICDTMLMLQDLYDMTAYRGVLSSIKIFHKNRIMMVWRSYVPYRPPYRMSLFS